MDAGERERIDGRQQHHRHGLQGYTWKSDTGSSGRRKERNGKRLQYDHRQGQAGAGSGRAGSRKRKAERGRAKQERSRKRNLQSMTDGSRWTAARGTRGKREQIAPVQPATNGHGAHLEERPRQQGRGHIDHKPPLIGKPPGTRQDRPRRFVQRAPAYMGGVV